MNNGYEYYYLFGLDIPLEQYKLGTIKQPKLIDYLSKDINIETFYTPFVMNDVLIGQLKNKEEREKFKSKNKNLSFLLVQCISANKLEIIAMLLNALKFLYQTDDVNLNDDATIRVGNSVIDDSNFNILCDVVLESLKIDKSKIKFEKENDEVNGLITKEMLEAKRKFLERQNKNKISKGMSVADLSHFIIQCSKFGYEDVLNMTVYQIKDTFESLNLKEVGNVNLLHRISPKFESSKDKYEHWTDKIKINKSSLGLND